MFCFVSRGTGGTKEKHKKPRERRETYIFPGNSTKTLQKQPTITPEGIHEQTLAGEHGLGDSLRLVVVFDPHRGGEKGVRAGFPLALADVGMHADGHDIAQEGRGQFYDPWTVVYRFGEFAAG